MKYRTIIETAFSGAVTIGTAMGMVTEETIIGMGTIVLFFLLGLVVQFFSTKDKKAQVKGEQKVTDSTKNSVKKPEVKTKKYLGTQFYGNSRKLIKEVFARDIYQEIPYVFPEIKVSRIVYMPQFKSEELWMCSCGNDNNDMQCIFCGMVKEELIKKMNFQYLDVHRKKRILQEQKKRQLKTEKLQSDMRIKIEAIGEFGKKILNILRKKGKKIYYEVKKALPAFFEQMKKKVIILIVGAIAFFGILGVLLYNNPTWRMKYYNYKAKHEEDYEQKREYYEKSLDEKKNLEAYKGCIDIACSIGAYSEAQDYNSSAEEIFGEDTEYIEYVEKFIPVSPQILLEEGVYEDRKEVQIYYKETGYEDEVYYSVNFTDAQNYQNPIKLDNSGSYVIETWVENAMGYKSEVAKCTYRINLPVPKDVQFSVLGGMYEQSQQVELTTEDVQIYYTLDGSKPTKNSLLYKEPIQIGFGITTIKAVGYNKEKDIYGNVMTETYYISYPDSCSTYLSECGVSGYYYDYVIKNSDVLFFDKTSGEIVKNLGQAGTQLNEYKARLYFLDSGCKVCSYNLESGKVEMINSEIQVLWMICCLDSIYYSDISGENLYRMNMDGSENTLVLAGEYIQQLVTFNEKLYVVTRDKVLELSENDGNLETLLAESVSDIYMEQDCMYIIQNGILFKVQDGNKEELISLSESYNYQEPVGLRDGYSVSYEEGCSTLHGSNQILLVTKYSVRTEKTYNWLTRKESDQTRTTNSWCVKMDLNSGEIIMFEDSTQILIADNAYYADGVRILMEH